MQMNTGLYCGTGSKRGHRKIHFETVLTKDVLHGR